MPTVDVVSESFLRVPPAVVAEHFRRPQTWSRWWPRLQLTVFMDRGDKGLRWSVTGELVGSCEVWTEAWHDGTVLHHYLRAEPVRPVRARRLRALRERYARSFASRAFGLKDALEGRVAGRTAGQTGGGALTPSAGPAP